MSSSKPRIHPGLVPESPTPVAGNPYARFIPREELRDFAAWAPDSFGSDQRNAPPVQAAQPQPQRDPQAVAAERAQELQAARQAGYQDGYRDGLAALENFKQSFTAQLTAQMSAQVTTLAESFGQRLESVEQQLAGRLAGVALELARQVVRTEIAQQPELVVSVAEEALAALLNTAKHVCVRLHPDDHALVGMSLKEALASRGARLIVDPAITRGGCLVESDIAVVDATIEARWKKVAALLGHDHDWGDTRPGPVLADA